jgi:hypothetical protein
LKNEERVMNLYQVKLKIGENDGTTQIINVVADTVIEAASKAHATISKELGPDKAESYRAVMVAEKAFGVVS